MKNSESKYRWSFFGAVLFVAGVAFFATACGKSADDGNHHNGMTRQGTAMNHHGGMKKTAHVDPVCGMRVTSAARWKTVRNGKTYYFCMEADKKKFDSNPQKYLKKK